MDNIFYKNTDFFKKNIVKNVKNLDLDLIDDDFIIFIFRKAHEFKYKTEEIIEIIEFFKKNGKDKAVKNAINFHNKYPTTMSWNLCLHQYLDPSLSLDSEKLINLIIKTDFFIPSKKEKNDFFNSIKISDNIFIFFIILLSLDKKKHIGDDIIMNFYNKFLKQDSFLFLENSDFLKKNRSIQEIKFEKDFVSFFFSAKNANDNYNFSPRRCILMKNKNKRHKKFLAMIDKKFLLHYLSSERKINDEEIIRKILLSDDKEIIQCFFNNAQKINMKLDDFLIMIEKAKKIETNLDFEKIAKVLA